jgi:hypothetical protein
MGLKSFVLRLTIFLARNRKCLEDRTKSFIVIDLGNPKPNQTLLKKKTYLWDQVTNHDFFVND